MNQNDHSDHAAVADADVATQLRALERALAASPTVTTILERAAGLGLPDWYLGAGAIAQTVWNELHGYAPGNGIRDYDVVYFDIDDLSADGETRVADALTAQLVDRAIRVDVKNQARVHLWYERRFGTRIGPYRSSGHAISTWPTTATSVGVRVEQSQLRVCAPFGLHDVFAMVARPNKTLITREVYEAKVRRWQATWPRLTVLGWDR